MAHRIAIGGVWHETNAFAAGTTSLADFHGYQHAVGADLLANHATARTEVGGALAACRERAAEAVPLAFAAAVPGPVVAAGARRAVWEVLLGRLDAAAPIDGVVLTLHGAMVAEDAADPDSELVAAVRGAAGDVPIAVTLDLHANPGSGLLDGADVVVGYDTYPHVDAWERGREACSLLLDTLERRRRLHVAWRRLPLLSCPLGQATDEEPMRSLVARAHALERAGRVSAASVLPGYPYADVPRLGLTVVACADDAPTAEDAAAELAAAAWDARESFRRRLEEPAAAVRRALAARHAPVVLADVADNVGGGAPGDGTAIAGELLAQGAQGAVVVLCDPEAVAAAVAAGPGGRAMLAVGGKVDDRHGPTLVLDAEIVRVADVRYRRTGTYMTGQQVDLGRCAVVAVEGVELVLTSRRAMPFDPDHLPAVGIDPAERRVLVAKSAIAWRAAFGAVARGVVYVDGPGICTCSLGRLPFTSRPRPAWPLEPATFSAAAG